MNMDKDICEKLGICWHEPEPYAHVSGTVTCKKCHKDLPWQNYFNPNPDFTTDAGVVMLLREMRRKYPDFITSLFSIDEAKWISYNPGKRIFLFDEFLNYILNPTLFRDKVWDWLCGGGK